MYFTIEIELLKELVRNQNKIAKGIDSTNGETLDAFKKGYLSLLYDFTAANSSEEPVGSGSFNVKKKPVNGVKD